MTSAGAQQTLTARLTMMPIDEVNRGIVTGSGSATAELDGDTLKLAGSFAGLQGPATVARLHQSLDRGIRGTALYDLTVTPDVAGSITGEIELTPEQVELLRAGRLYIQIHSTSAPEGNLWGWLL
jgi:hypothetical protein